MAEDGGTADEDTSGDSGAPDPKTARKKQLKNEHILIGVGVVTLLVMYYMMKKQQAAAASSTTSSTTASPLGQASYPSGDYEGGYNGYSGDTSGIAQSLAAIQAELTGLTSPTTSTTPISTTTTPPAGGNVLTLLTGSDASGTGVASTVQNDLNSGIPVYYEDTPGSAPQQVTQAGQNAQWQVGGKPISSMPNAASAPGSPGGFYTFQPA